MKFNIRSPIKRLKQSFLDLQIQKKLMLSFALLIVLPVTLMAVFYLSNSKIILENKTSQYTSDILKELQKNIENTATDLNSVFEQVHNNATVQTVLYQVTLKQVNPEEAETYYTGESHLINSVLSEALYSHPTISSIGLITYFNHNLSSIAPKDSIALTEEQLMTIQNSNGEAVWLKYSEGIISYAQPVISLQDSSPIGYLIINMSEDELFNIYSNISLYKENDIFITDNKGFILSHGDKDLLGTRVEADYRQLVNKPDDTPLTLKTLNGQRYYIASRMINDGEWCLFYQISEQDFESDFISLMQIFFGITFIILLLALSVSVVLSRSIANPITELSKTMQQVRNGNFRIRSNYKAKDEVGILSDNFNRMIENANELVQTIYQKELLKQEAELRYLKFQINPHFLYNTLETINWISRIKGVPEAGEIAKALGDLMREGLKDEDFAQIKDEIKNVENYILIQQYRYGDKIKVSINIDPSVSEAKTPKFVLQPIVENAIIHGLDSKIEGGNIRIYGGSDGKDIVLTVEDDGIGIPEEVRRNLLNENLRKAESDEKSAHIGILNVHKRLQLYFGPQYGLRISSEEGVGTVVAIHLPLPEENDDTDASDIHQ